MDDKKGKMNMEKLMPCLFMLWYVWKMISLDPRELHL